MVTSSLVQVSCNAYNLQLLYAASWGVGAQSTGAVCALMAATAWNAFLHGSAFSAKQLTVFKQVMLGVSPNVGVGDGKLSSFNELHWAGMCKTCIQTFSKQIRL